MHQTATPAASNVDSGVSLAVSRGRFSSADDRNAPTALDLASLEDRLIARQQFVCVRVASFTSAHHSANDCIISSQLEHSCYRMV